MQYLYAIIELSEAVLPIQTGLDNAPLAVVSLADEAAPGTGADSDNGLQLSSRKAAKPQSQRSDDAESAVRHDQDAAYLKEGRLHLRFRRRKRLGYRLRRPPARPEQPAQAGFANIAEGFSPTDRLMPTKDALALCLTGTEPNPPVNLAAVVSERTTLPATSPALLWQHEHVVEALSQGQATLPVRFGTCLPDAAAIRALLLEREGDFRAALDRVRGRVEVGVRVLWDEPEPVTRAAQSSANTDTGAQPGKAYMLQRLAATQAVEAQRQRAEARAATLHAQLAAHAVASNHTVLPGAKTMLRAAYLVDAVALVEFRAVVATLSAAHPDLRILCTGPWPAYNFVEGAAG